MSDAKNSNKKSDPVFGVLNTEIKFGEPNTVCEKCWWNKKGNYGTYRYCQRREIRKVNMVTGEIEVTNERNGNLESERNGYDHSKQELLDMSKLQRRQAIEEEDSRCGEEGKYFLNAEQVETAKELFPDQFVGDVPIPENLHHLIPMHEEAIRKKEEG